MKGLRLYTADNCKNCDPTGFVLEGRADDASPWVPLGDGDFEGVSGGLDRNPTGLDISSTYESGDTSLTFVEIDFPTNSEVFYEYRVTFPGTRSPTSHSLRFAELEVPGMLIPPEPSTSPTPVPTISPTDNPTASPTTSPSANPTAELPAGGTLVANILDGDTFTNFGCNNVGKPWRSSDGTTTKYFCDRTGMHNFTTGIIATSTTGQLTIPKEFRVYAANACKSCDPEFYTLEGRTDATSEWVEVSSGYLPWAFTPNAELLRNDQGLTISSSYASADPNLAFTNVHFHGHSEPYLDYRMTFVTRSATVNTFQFGAMEIAGMVLP